MPWLVVKIFILLIHMKAFDINQFFKYNVGKESREKGMMFYVFKIIGENYNIAVMPKCLPKQRISDLRRTFCTGVSTIYGTAQIH